MKHIMVDIETMGTRPMAPVLSIGAVVFSKDEGLLDSFYEECSMSSAFIGAKPSVNTITWWMKQSNGPRLKLANAKGSHNTMLDSFSKWVIGVDNLAGVWGNGACFDNTILKEAFLREKIDCPWPYWADRCYRTVKNMFTVPFDRVGEHHNALDDAKTQATHLLAISAKHGGFL